MLPTASRRCVLAGWFALSLMAALLGAAGPGRGQERSPVLGDRSPVDLALSGDGRLLATANQTSHTVSLVRIADGSLLDEVPVGRFPVAIVACGERFLVTCRDSGQLWVLEVAGERLRKIATIQVGFHPYGVAVTPDRRRAFVARSASAEVAVVDLVAGRVERAIAVGRWPRYLALAPEAHRLAVGTSGDGGVTIVDTQTLQAVYQQSFVGLNLGQMQATRDGKYAYFPWIVYRGNPITAANIRRGWVLASRLARVRLDADVRREAISLDPQGEAVGDPHGLRLTSDERLAVISAGGTHELLLIQLADLPVKDYGSTDHIEPELLDDPKRFARLSLGGRPLGLRIGPQDRYAYVANYLKNAVQVVDLQTRRVTRTLPLGSASKVSLARQGEAIFYDARRSLDQWYSCHSCHYEGGGNATRVDTLNDGTALSFKMVLPLFHVTETGPWTWHGWQKSLPAAMRKSITSTMLGRPPDDYDVRALIAYLETLALPPNPYADPALTADPARAAQRAAVERGRRLFTGDVAGCAVCHSGPHYTDGEIHDLKLGKPNDRYVGFNTPSLRGVYRRVKFLHDGRADSLEALLKGPHNPAKVTGKGSLSSDQLADLIAFLKTL